MLLNSLAVQNNQQKRIEKKKGGWNEKQVLVMRDDEESEEDLQQTMQATFAKRNALVDATLVDGTLPNRLVEFQNWAVEEAKITIHPSVCITTTRSSSSGKAAAAETKSQSSSNNDNAFVANSSGANETNDSDDHHDDDEDDGQLYTTSMGCQIQTKVDGEGIQKGEVLLTVPRRAMITPDLIQTSDAGRAVVACVFGNLEKTKRFWEPLENTVLCEQKFYNEMEGCTNQQFIERILKERKRAEDTYKVESGYRGKPNLARPGTISTRAPFLAFLIHQRYHDPKTNQRSSAATKDSYLANLPEEMYTADKKTLVEPKITNNDNDRPETFGPYARILPQSFTLPICWDESDLKLLGSSITGSKVLQEVMATTCQLATEYCAILEAGIMRVHCGLFSDDMITWDRWLWAAACFTSRVLPMDCYINNNSSSNAASGGDVDAVELQSPREIWGELGVMIPVMDMLNHDIELQSVKWETSSKTNNINDDNSASKKGDDAAGKEDAAVVVTDKPSHHHHPCAVMEKDVSKGQQIYISYGNELSNRLLLLQYGFTQISNESDEVPLGWGLMDAVGNVDRPADYTTLTDDELNGDDVDVKTYLVYESMESAATRNWWFEDRTRLLEGAAFPNVDTSFVSSLKMGQKMISSARSDGTYDPCLLIVAVYATIPLPELRQYVLKYDIARSNGRGIVPALSISKRHQRVLRSYLTFLFSRKLEKLLQHLSGVLKGHFSNMPRIWTSASKGGIRYHQKDGEKKDDALGGDKSNRVVGWETFFKENATIVEGETTQYAVDPKSCVLALYDGHLKSLQVSIDGLLTLDTFEESVLQQLAEMGFMVKLMDEVSAEGNVKPNFTRAEENMTQGEEDSNPAASKRSRLN